MLQLNADGNNISHIFLQATGGGHWILTDCSLPGIQRADHRIGADVRKTDGGVIGKRLNPVELVASQRHLVRAVRAPIALDPEVSEPPAFSTKIPARLENHGGVSRCAVWIDDLKLPQPGNGSSERECRWPFGRRTRGRALLLSLDECTENPTKQVRPAGRCLFLGDLRFNYLDEFSSIVRKARLGADLCERGLAICEKRLGPHHTHTASSLNNLGLLLRAQGEHAKALPLFERALGMYESALGPEHPTANRVRSNAARVYLALGNPAAALDFANTALLSHEKILGKNHYLTTLSAGVTASALRALGRVDEAVALRKRYERRK